MTAFKHKTVGQCAAQPLLSLMEGQVFILTRDEVLFGAMMFGGIIVVRLAYSVFLVHRVLTAIHGKRPLEWSAYNRNRLRWIVGLVAGNPPLSPPDNDYRRRLSSVRWNLRLCLAYLILVIVAIAWIMA